MFLEIVSSCYWDKPLEVVTPSLPFPPLEVGGSYRSGADACSCTTSVEYGNTLGNSGGKDYTVHKFANIVRTASIASICESHMLVRTSLSASDKKCMAWVTLSSAVTWGCVRYACKYYATSVIISDLVLLSISWMQR